MKRWLQSVTPDRSTLEKHWCLKHFTAFMLDRRCWTFNRASVSRSFALGLFIAFIPPTPLPVHLVTCALLSVFFRLNLPVLIATVFVSNPFTWVPQVAGSLWVGAKLLGWDLMPFLHAISHRTLWADMGLLWPPLLLGSPGPRSHRGCFRLRTGTGRMARPGHLSAAATPRALKRAQHRARLGSRLSE